MFRGLPRSVLYSLLALTVLRLVLAATNDLSPDEAQYTMWSERLAPSYYSKGPGVALAIKTSTAVFGKTELGVRFLAPLLALGSSLLIFRLGRLLFDERTGSWAVVAANLTPIFNVGATVMTIDPISVFLWLAAMLGLWLALNHANPLNRYWAITGLCIGAGFLAKYTNAIQLLSIVLLFGLCQRWRPEFRRPGLYVLLGAFAVCTIPVLIWNAQHGWITVTHLQERGKLDESTGLHPAEFFEYVGIHFGAYSPLLFIGLVAALVAGTRRFFTDKAQAFLVAFSLPIIVLYFLLSWREAGEGNWTAPGFAGVTPLLAYHWQRFDLPGRKKALLRNATIWLAALLSAITLHTDVVRATGIDRAATRPLAFLARWTGSPPPPDHWPYQRDPSKRVIGWHDTADAVAAVVRNAADSLGAPVFLIANNYQTAAILDFYLPDDLPVIRPDLAYPPVHCIEHPLPQNQFSFWPRYDGRPPGGDLAPAHRDSGASPASDSSTAGPSPFLGATALYITDDADRESEPEMIRRTFDATAVTGVIDIMRRGHLVRTIKVFACYEYQGLPL